MTIRDVSGRHLRRRILQAAGAVALVSWLPLRAAEGELPNIPALAAFLAGRAPRWERLRLELPRLAGTGQAVPVAIRVDGPFAPGPTVRAIRLYSQKNPVPEMAVFEFPASVERIGIDSRVRLAGTQLIAAVAVMSVGTLYGAAANVIVTIDSCLDGT